MSIFAIPSRMTHRTKATGSPLPSDRKENKHFLQPQPGCRAGQQSRIYVFRSEANLSSRNARHLGRTSPSLGGAQWAGGRRGAPRCGLRGRAGLPLRASPAFARELLLIHGDKGRNTTHMFPPFSPLPRRL